MIPEDTFARHNELLRYVNQNLTIPPLKAICKTVGLQMQGRKNMLQMRIVGRLNELRAANRVNDYEILKRAILDQYAEHFATRPVWNSPPAGTGVSAYAGTAAAAHRVAPAMVSGTIAGTGGAEPMVFKSSPFFVLLAQLYNPCYCGAIPEHRSSFTMSFRFTQSQLDKMKDSTYRVYLLSALSEDAYRQATIQFPQSMEIRVNGKVVQVNLRGLKNKPGTAKPADLTDYMAKDTMTRNVVEVVYAYTRQRYTVTLHLARKRSVQDIVTRIVAGKRFAKETVIGQITKNHVDDDDIVATSSIVSLKCPLSFGRIQVPIRAIGCSHVQCFDATSYIQLQEQAPTWQCPICNIYAPIEDLVVDNYFDEILKNTSKDVESIEIDPSGTWRVPEQNGVVDDSDSEDEMGAGRSTQRANALEVIDSSPGRGGSRAPANVIDLTLSDDEEPARSTSRPGQPAASNNGFHEAPTTAESPGSRRESSGLSGLFTPSEPGEEYQTDQGNDNMREESIDDADGPLSMLAEAIRHGDAESEEPATSVIETPNRIENFINSIPDFSDYVPSPTPPPPLPNELRQLQPAQQAVQQFRPGTPSRSYPGPAPSFSLPAITPPIGTFRQESQTAMTSSPPPARGYFSSPPRPQFGTFTTSASPGPISAPVTAPVSPSSNRGTVTNGGTSSPIPPGVSTPAFPRSTRSASEALGPSGESDNEPPAKRHNSGPLSSLSGDRVALPEWAIMPSPSASTVVIEQSSDRVGNGDV
ncbi:PINIT domain-containing protein [Lipomyces orientalis]|uniref:PINIT domain-containing protein n=1 Tax=Lipomyces orientalis TaxID=1233043 RepID=A0ACC3TGB5_9ASCO